MTLPQLLGMCFAACTIVCWLNVYRIVIDKRVMGVSVIPVLVFITTNFVELFYFGARGEWWGLAGAAGMLSANVTWLVLYIYYQRKQENENADA